MKKKSQRQTSLQRRKKRALPLRKQKQISQRKRKSQRPRKGLNQNKKMDDELEELKRKKLMQQLQMQQQSSFQEEAKLQQQISQLEIAVKQFFSKEALERYGNIKAAHPEKSVQLLAVIGQLVQAGRIKDKLTDEQLKEILKRLTPKKKEFKIKRS